MFTTGSQTIDSQTIAGWRDGRLAQWQPFLPLSNSLTPCMQEWEQLAELTLTPDITDSTGLGEQPQLASARVIWRGDGKFFATVCRWEGSRWVPF